MSHWVCHAGRCGCHGMLEEAGKRLAIVACLRAALWAHHIEREVVADSWSQWLAVLFSLARGHARDCSSCCCLFSHTKRLGLCTKLPVERAADGRPRVLCWAVVGGAASGHK